MVKDEDWVGKRVNEAHKAHPSVTVSVASRMAELIAGNVMGRQLSTAELKVIAKMLLADSLAPASANMGGTDAD